MIDPVRRNSPSPGPPPRRGLRRHTGAHWPRPGAPHVQDGTRDFVRKIPRPTSHRLRLVGPTQQLFADGWPAFLQGAGQLLDRHAVDARTALVGLHPLQSPQAILPLADLFHQLFIVPGRAFGHAFRRARFGPFARIPRSFTPPLLAKGQPKLDFLPLAARGVPSPTLGIQPFEPSSRRSGLLCQLLTSAAGSERIAAPSVPIPGHATDLPR